MLGLLKKTPAVAIAALVTAQLATLLPFFANGKIRPLFFVYMDEISLLDLTPTICFALGHATALAAMLLMLHIALGKWGLRFGAAAVIVQFLCMLVAALYYSNFGQYPRTTLIHDLMITPVSVVGYGISGATGSDFLFGSLAAATLILLSLRAIEQIERHDSPGDGLFLATALAVGMLAVGLSLVNNRGAHGALRVSQYHGIPTALLWGSLADTLRQSPRNQPACATAHLPVSLTSLADPEFERPDHILLIVMESFRADHLPQYGYSRNTMPRLSADRDDWIVFSHYRSAAPMTAASLRAILSSRYLQLGSNENAINQSVDSFWQAMSTAGYRTALMTGANMRWHYLDKVTKAHQCDEFVHFNAVDMDTRRQHLLRDRSDSSLNDSYVIERCSSFLQAAQHEQHPCFCMLYLLNVHQPYYSDPEDRQFADADLPQVVADAGILDMNLSASHRKSLINQYDNSIVNFDKNLSNLLAHMEADGHLERSVVIVTGDHGEAFGEHGTFYHGTTVYDEQIKVPLMIRVGAELPRLRQALAVNQRTVTTGVDLHPTIVSIAGGRPAAGVEGTSLTATQRKSYDFVFWNAGYQMAAVFTESEKYIYDMETRVAEGFDLRRDPDETTNMLDESFEDFSSFLQYLRRQGVITTTTARPHGQQAQRTRNRSLQFTKAGTSLGSRR